MGVNAQMLIKKQKEALSKNDLIRYSYKIKSAFSEIVYHQAPEENKYSTSGSRTLKVIDEYMQDGDSILSKNGEQLIEVDLSCRFYGIGYERGPLPDILMLAKFIKANISDCSIWYGGDSSGCCAQELTPKYEKELWNHFCDSINLEYQRYFGKLDPPICDFDKEPMIEYSWGPNGRVKFCCMACDIKKETFDKGQTFNITKDN